jgi:hypothetical protein
VLAGVERPVSHRRQPLILRGFAAILGVAALVVAVLWTYALAYALGDEYSLEGFQSRDLIILGVLGIAASLTAGGSGLTYARTMGKMWIPPLVAGTICAIPVLIVWIDLWERFGGSD